MVDTASDLCFGGVCWGLALPGVARCPLGVGRGWSLCSGMPFLRVGPGAHHCAFFLCATPRSFFFLAHGWFPAPVLCRSRCPVPVGACWRISSKVCTMFTPSRLLAPPAHFTQQRSSRKAGADHQARWAGAWGEEVSKLEVLEWQVEDVVAWGSRSGGGGGWGRRSGTGGGENRGRWA